MHLPLFIHKAIDWLLTLLPGKASDPASLEARVRRAGAVADSAFERATAIMGAAQAHEEALEKAVSEKAAAAKQAAERGIEALEARIAKLKELI